MRKSFAYWVILDALTGREICRHQKLSKVVEQWVPGTYHGYSERSFNEAVSNAQTYVQRAARVRERLEAYRERMAG